MGKHHKKFQRGDAGMALLLATVFVAVALLTMGALSVRYLQQRVEADSYQVYTKDFDAVEAGMGAAKLKMENNLGNGTIGLNGWTPKFNDKKELVLPDFDATGSQPQTLPADPGDTSSPPPQFLAYTLDWGNNHRDDNGDGAVDDPKERNMYSIHVAAKYRNVVRRAEAVYRAVNVNVWQNAIFAGAGAAGGVINGNVDIHGSVHILGDQLTSGDVALADLSAVDLGGTSLVGNNYKGIPGYFAARVPALPVTDVNGTMASTLDAKLRVKHGLVGMSGNSHIGEPTVNGSPVKLQMDGTFVTDGWTGTQITPTADGRGLPSSVYSDNGFNRGYDLGDRVSFPLLSDPWREPDTGDYKNRTSGAKYSHEEYFSEVLLADPVNPSDGIYTGNIVLDVNADDSTGAVFWDASTNTHITGNAAVTATPGSPTDDYFRFVPSKRLLEFPQKTADNNAGQIRINGTLSFSGKGNDDTINYTGRAAFLVTGDINIDVKLLTCNNGDISTFGNSFPARNCLGLMTKSDIKLGSGEGASQLDIMGGFYAEKKITSKKQTRVMGTFVSSYFDMGSQVPAIFQVPDLAVNLPLGMIGNYPIMNFSREAWREMGLG